MAQEYDNNMSGIISRNERKEKETHPDYRGSCEIENKEFWISGWVKERKDGTGSFLSLRFQSKEDQLAPGSVAPAGATLGEGDTPF